MAIRHWQGKAGGQAQTFTITIADTWAGADTITITINTKTLVLIVGALTSTNDVAEALAAAINASSQTDGVVGTELRNVGGQQIPELTELVATVASNVVTLTGTTLGKPIALAVSEVTAGDGTATLATTVIATGPNHADNANNWSGNTLPADGDTIRFDEGAVSCLYALDYFRTNSIALNFVRTGDYTGTIGLPATNADNSSATYAEYRDRYLELYDAGDAKTIDFEAGDRGGSGGETYLDLQGQTFAALNARDLGSISTTPKLQVHGGTVSAFYMGLGECLVDPDDAQQTGGMTIDALIAGAGGSESASLLTLGRLTEWASGGTAIAVRGCTLTLDCALDQGTPEATPTIHTGTLVARGDGTVKNVTVRDGTFQWAAGGTANGTIDVWGDGTLDLTGDGRTKTFSGTINAHEGATILKGGHNPTITPVGCTVEDLNLTA